MDGSSSWDNDTPSWRNATPGAGAINTINRSKARCALRGSSSLRCLLHVAAARSEKGLEALTVRSLIDEAG
jgi:hypothetical protein